MKGFSLIIPATDNLAEAHEVMRDTTREYDRPLRLDELQFAVGGDIEIIPEFSCMRMGDEERTVIAFCNEEGRVNHLADNPAANHIYSRSISIERGLSNDYPIDPQWRLVGPVVVVWGDEEFMNAL